MFKKILLPGLALPLALGACVSDSFLDVAPVDNNPPLADADVLLGGEPEPASIQRIDAPFDGLLPSAHNDLVALMSPVKSQGKRGVCSIFSTAGLMEHLYIKEGTIVDPDFSEQYLQWSAKFEVGSFPNTSGSNAFYNLRAIRDFGIVEESAWPYESIQWGVDEDEDCTGEDDQPTRCYTNGQPGAEVLAAQKFSLPSHRSLHPLDIKDHIAQQGTGVVVGFTFFYQAWNHRVSELPTSDENWAQGVVLYPNAEDEKKSLEKRAGHSILIIGWDDDMQVAKRDQDGEIVVDASGEPVMETGFYLFKNSWGTSSFGVDHPDGAGYGYISQRYINEYGRPRIAKLPTNIVLPPEQCGDGIDNDRNGFSDCEDFACSAAVECVGQGADLVLKGAGGSIPDNDEIGFIGSLESADSGTIADLTLTLDISHSYRGDLVVILKKGDVSSVVLNREGGSAQNIADSFLVPAFEGETAAGKWELIVLDEAQFDSGVVQSWSLAAKLTDEL